MDWQLPEGVMSKQPSWRVVRLAANLGQFGLMQEYDTIEVSYFR